MRSGVKGSACSSGLHLNLDVKKERESLPMFLSLFILLKQQSDQLATLQLLELHKQARLDVAAEIKFMVHNLDRSDMPVNRTATFERQTDAAS
jgi:hypothetical protein